MMSIDSVFNIINFLSRIAVVIYLVHRFVINKVKISMHVEEQALVSLKKQQVELKKTCVDLEESMVQDQHSFDQLQQKFTIWQKQIEQQQAEEIAACQIRQQKIKQLLEQRAEYLQHRQMLHEQLPLIIDQVRSELQQEFANNSKLVQEYQNKVLQALK